MDALPSGPSTLVVIRCRRPAAVATIGRVRRSSRDTAAITESLMRSTRSTTSRYASSASVRPDAASTSVAVSCTESGPAPSSAPYNTRPAPVRRPSSAAEAGSARPRHSRVTSVGVTARSGPARSRPRDRTSTNPSRQSASCGGRTSNGATATRSGSNRTCRSGRATSAAPMPVSSAAPSASFAAVTPAPRRGDRGAAGSCTAACSGATPSELRRPPRREYQRRTGPPSDSPRSRSASSTTAASGAASSS